MRKARSGCPACCSSAAPTGKEGRSGNTGLRSQIREQPGRREQGGALGRGVEQRKYHTTIEEYLLMMRRYFLK